MICNRILPGILSFFIFLCFSSTATSQSRISISLNKNWSFVKDPGGKLTSAAAGKNWQTINLPHTWNDKDVTDDVPGYYRDAAWYKKKFTIDPRWRNKKVFLSFNAVGQEAEVYVNGKLAGTHAGSYNRFVVPVSEYLNFNAGALNEVAVKASNRFNENIPPLTADFTFFGGIYRSVNLIVVDQVHFDNSEYGADALYLSTPQVTDNTARINVRGSIVNATGRLRNVRVVTVLNDAAGKQIKRSESLIGIEGAKTISFTQDLEPLIMPHLWSPENPYLYKSVTTLIDPNDGRVLDELVRHVGLRWFSFDAEKGFFLNGKPYKLIGASRHQDYKGIGNAVPESLQVKDIELLKAMGANFLRVAHYPQDQVVLEACDRLGLLASIEIPVVNEITETEAFTQNCLNMQREMIRQNYNHPSVIIWGYMNEVMLRPHFSNDKAKQETYFSNIVQLAQKLEDVTRAEDPSRYTMIANHGSFDLYTRTGLTKIPMIVGWNLYQGWYSGKIEDFGPFLDMVHQKQPDKPFLVTEYGADADPRIHTSTPEKFDKSAEYAVLYHVGYLRDIMKRPFVAGAMVWNLADFNSETREETMPHINNKGLMTIDRKPKNPYYLYQANLLKKPYVKIGDGTWSVRGGVAAKGGNSSTQSLQVMSNAEVVTLFLNGKELGQKKIEDHIANWDVPFINGKNTVKAVAIVAGAKVEDNALIDFRLQPAALKSNLVPFKDINIVLGSKRQVVDEAKHEIWLPDQEYQPGTWGHIGGEAYRVNNGRQAYGTDKDIAGTELDPVYQTQLTGIEAYRFDVPSGKYKLALHFAELAGGGAQSLVYNLNSQAVRADVVDRVFDVYLNGKLIMKDFNISKDVGNARAAVRTFDCSVSDGKGIEVSFKAKNGKAVLNAIQLKKIG